VYRLFDKRHFFYYVRYLTALPRLPSWILKRPTSKGREGKGREGRGREGRGKGGRERKGEGEKKGEGKGGAPQRKITTTPLCVSTDVGT